MKLNSFHVLWSCLKLVCQYYKCKITSCLYLSRSRRWPVLQTDHCVPHCETSNSGAGQGCLGNPAWIPQTGGQTRPGLLRRSVDGWDSISVPGLQKSVHFVFFLTHCSAFHTWEWNPEMVQWSSADSAYVGGGKQNDTFNAQLLNDVRQETLQAHRNMSTNDSH